MADRASGNRQRFILLFSILGRFGVGFCDLLVAAAMYLLFLLAARAPDGASSLVDTKNRAFSCCARYGIRGPSNIDGPAFVTLRFSPDSESAHGIPYFGLPKATVWLQWGRFVDVTEVNSLVMRSIQPVKLPTSIIAALN